MTFLMTLGTRIRHLEKVRAVGRAGEVISEVVRESG
jgi:hypothetical protein